MTFCPSLIIKQIYRRCSLNLWGLLNRYQLQLMFLLGVALLSFGLSGIASAQVQTFHQPDYNDSLIRNAVGNLFGLIEGAFGALIMVVSGLGAIVAAAMGAYRAAMGMLVVAIGAFILRALVSLFFGENFEGVNIPTGG